MLMLALDTASAAVSVALHDGGRVLVARSCRESSRHAEMLMPLVVECLEIAGADRRDLTAVAVGVGPGPFTGLRVGIVTARTLGFALGVPVHGVCSLDALAAEALAAEAVAVEALAAEAVAVEDLAPEDLAPEALATEFVVATDARRREVYWARYRRDGARHIRVEGPAVSLPVDVPHGDDVPVIGRGAVLYPDVLGASPGARSLPGPGSAPAAAHTTPGPQGHEQVLDPTGAGVAGLVAALLRGGGPLDVPLLPPDPLYLRRPDAVPSVTRKPVSA